MTHFPQIVNCSRNVFTKYVSSQNRKHFFVNVTGGYIGGYKIVHIKSVSVDMYIYICNRVTAVTVYIYTKPFDPCVNVGVLYAKKCLNRLQSGKAYRKSCNRQKPPRRRILVLPVTLAVTPVTRGRSL